MFVVVRRRAAAVTAALAALGALVGGLVLAGPASADDSFPAVLDVGVSVDRPAPTPGQTFTYTIHVGCSSADCLGATVVDQLPSLFDALTVNSDGHRHRRPGHLHLDRRERAHAHRHLHPAAR